MSKNLKSRLYRDEELNKVLRGRKPGVMHHKNQERGGARNQYFDYVQEYEEEMKDKDEIDCKCISGRDDGLPCDACKSGLCPRCKILIEE